MCLARVKPSVPVCKAFLLYVPSYKRWDRGLNRESYFQCAHFQPLLTEESSDDEIESESPLDEIVNVPDFDHSNAESSGVFPPSSLALREQQANSSARSDTR